MWFSSWAEHLGQFMELAAVLWLVHEMTSSPLLLTIVGASRFVPGVFLSIFAGALADRMDRRKLLMISLIWMIIFSSFLAVLVFMDWVKIWHIVVISLLESSAVSFNHPSRQSMIPNLVRREHLMNAIAQNGLSVMGSRVVGIIIAGYLLAAVGVGPVIAARAVGAFVAIALALMATVPPTPSAAREKTARHNIADGLAYVRSNKLTLSLIAMFIFPQFATLTVTSLMPAFADEILHIGAKGFGWLTGVMSGGAMVGTFIIAYLYNFRHKGLLLVTAGIFMGATLMGFSQSQWFLFSLLLLLVTGIMNSIFRGLNTTLIQGIIPDEMRGRIMSLREFSLGLGSGAALLGGVIGERAGISFAVALSGGMIISFILGLTLLLPRIRKME
jgi:MFS family permease